ncbi:MAG: type II toxin-antitoxin system VapB family antitoxin [Sporichthyaceae bacterium]
MPDILIRDVPPEVLAALDAQAERMGLSRSEYLRRRLAADAGWTVRTFTAEDLRRSAEAFSDLNDPAVMSAAWE